LSPDTIESSRGPIVASTIVRGIPAGKIITIVSGSAPCSILMLTGVATMGATGDDAIGFVDGCASTRGAAGLLGVSELSIRTARVSGMLTKST
jgi:hypothetical protein